MVVSAPFWLPIVVRYHGHVANTAPSDYVWPPLASGREATSAGSPSGGTTATSIWQFLREFFWRWPMLVIAVGLSLWIAGTLRQKTKITSWAPPRMLPVTGAVGRDAVWIVATWTVWSFVGLLLASYRIVSFPFPSYHFLFYLSAALCIWFGISLYVIVRASFALAERSFHWGRSTNPAKRQEGNLYRRWGALAVTASVAGIAIFTFPSWHERQTWSARELFPCMFRRAPAPQCVGFAPTPNQMTSFSTPNEAAVSWARSCISFRG